MIELFSIFTKGGVCLWNYQEGDYNFTDTVNNELIKGTLMQERGNTGQKKVGNYTMKFQLDNEYNVIFLVIYQSIVNLSYAEKLLSLVIENFREQYSDNLRDETALTTQPSKIYGGFDDTFENALAEASRSAKASENVVKKPKTFQESAKSQKTIDSLIVSRPGQKKDEKPGKGVKETSKPAPSSPGGASSDGYNSASPPGSPDEEVARQRAKLFNRMAGNSKKKSPEEPAPAKAKGKQARVWALSGKASDVASLDRSNPKENDENAINEEESRFVDSMRDHIGSLKGDLKALQESDDEDDDDADHDVVKQSSGGWFSMIKGLVGEKKLTSEDLTPLVEKMRDNLIMKNVASEPAEKICQSVVSKLEGKVVTNFTRVAQEVKTAVRESLVQLLTPKHRVDILRDVVEAKREGRPYVIVFCGVNGVGKSTNLAKITFWLTENKHRVLIAAGDTFRAGAVEQLRTHTRHLNALHPQSVHLYEQGYGKDAAGLAAAAIKIAAERHFDVVLVDTAGRMQDNEPLMRELAKLIRVNEPDLVLFVGEALVGNEAVDQLVKFNEALANHATPGQKPRLIDGIVLTKFDTIDDKVGAAVSMTYITGQPILFVGCGQTYADLRNLNVGAVVHSLLN
uniref:SRP54 domain-containing protein n=1 Tax=Caenorhabditis japonica TaxID=281687 RepID=A0A8R1DSJ3_CAEJA